MNVGKGCGNFIFECIQSICEIYIQKKKIKGKNAVFKGKNADITLKIDSDEFFFFTAGFAIYCLPK